MSKKDEALKLAEDALKRVRTQDMELVQLSMIALAAIRKALAEQPAPMIRGDIRDGLVDDEPAQPAQQQMPDDWFKGMPEEYRRAAWRIKEQPKSVRPLVYGDTPPRAQRKPLTRKQLADAWIGTAHITHATERQIAYARAVEAAHDIKGDA